MEILTYLSNVILFVLHITNSESFPKTLSKAEEEKLIDEMENGNENAKAELIEHNLRLVAHIIKKYYSNYSDQDDLISIGTIGLIKGINSFKKEKGTKLATYAARCIENEILMYFRSTKKTQQEISISEPIDTDNEGNPLTLMDIISVDDTVIEDIDISDKYKIAVKYINGLKSKRDKKIITERYGLNGKKPKTQKEIAKELKISRSYVSRIEKRILTEIRKETEKTNNLIIKDKSKS